MLQTIILEIKIELAQTSKLCLIPSNSEIAANDSFSLDSGLINIVCTLSAHTFTHLNLFFFFLLKNPIFPFHPRLPHSLTGGHAGDPRLYSQRLLCLHALMCLLPPVFVSPQRAKRCTRDRCCRSRPSPWRSVFWGLCAWPSTAAASESNRNTQINIYRFATLHAVVFLFCQTLKRCAFTLTTLIVTLVRLNINTPFNTRIYRFLPWSLPVETTHTRK